MKSLFDCVMLPRLSGAALLLMLSCQSVRAAASEGWIEGRVLSAVGSQALAGVHVTISRTDGPELTSGTTDTAGEYRFGGLAPGEYELSFRRDGCRPGIVRPVTVHSGRVSVVDIGLEKAEATSPAPVVAAWTGEPANPWGTGHGGVFEQSRLLQLPGPRNIWALLENQDPSSVTNQPDEGGIATGTVALAGVRGSSWTQNGYSLDGIDITDPFESGKPLLYSDFGSLEELHVSSALHPSEARAPGGTFSLASRRGGSRFHAEAEGYYLDEHLQDNDSGQSDLRDFTMAPRFKRLSEGQFVASGPVPRTGKLVFFTSLGIQDLSRIIPGFPASSESSVYSGLLRFDWALGGRDQLSALAAGQIVRNSHLGARPGVSPSATLQGNDRFEVVQGRWSRRRNATTLWQVSFGFSHTSPTDTFQKGITEPNRTVLFTGEMAGAAPLESDSARSRFSLVAQGHSWLRGPRGWQHTVDFGLDLEKSMSTEERRIFADFRQIYFPAASPVQVVRYNTPSRTKQRLAEFSLFFDDQIRLSDRLFLRFGATLDSSRASLPSQHSGAGSFTAARDFPGAGGIVSWTTISPRLGVAIPVRPHSGGPRFSAGLSRYYHRLPARYADFANPASLGGQVFQWNDPNRDGLYQTGEEGVLQGAFGGPYSSVDPGLRRPFTDELTFGLAQRFHRNFGADLRFFYRREKRLIETTNTGVPASAFTPVEIFDRGDDNIEGTVDDRILTVFDQDPQTLGRDHFLLTNPGLGSVYRGLEATIELASSRRGSLSLSFSAYEAVGEASPGNSELQNDTGVIGTLLDNPNTLLNARGRLFFDRAYVGKLAGTLQVPWGIRLGSVIKYLDGLPFGRRLIVTGLHQGPFFVMATPRGQPGGLRTESNLVFDQRIAREFEAGPARLSVLVDVFNLLNLRRHLREYDISGPLFPLRLPLEVQNPRVFRIGVRLELH